MNGHRNIFTNNMFPISYVPQQRQGDNRATRTVDDIAQLITVLDENNSLSLLPTYVSDGPDNMPSLRLFDGDFHNLLSIIRSLEKKLEEYGSTGPWAMGHCPGPGQYRCGHLLRARRRWPQTTSLINTGPVQCVISES